MRLARPILSVLAAVVVVVILAGVGFSFWAEQPAIGPIAPPPASSFDKATIIKGAALAQLGDCAVCHTTPGGPSLAGGYPVETPFGVIYGTNITPDPDTGIGRWSEAAFVRALREGVRRDGAYLYPAFPYTHFTRVSDEDAKALYAYLMTREPVRKPNRPPQLPFPLDIRLVMAGWNLLYFHPGRFRPEPGQSPVWNRGAYLAEGLGHCGACHTPLNVLGSEVADAAYSGGEAEGWWAPALNDASAAPIPWTKNQLIVYLRAGFASDHGVAAGPMAAVARDLQLAPSDDVASLATYVASLDHRQTPAQPLPLADQAAFKIDTAPTVALSAPANSGAAIFAGACASCHFEGGSQPFYRPVSLTLSSVANAPDARNFLHIVIEGIEPPPGRRGRWMPSFDQLTDQQAIAVANYVRSHFTRKPAWTGLAETIARIRRKDGP